MIYLTKCFFFMFLMLGVCWSSESVDLVLVKFEKSWAIISSNVFCIISSLFLWRLQLHKIFKLSQGNWFTFSFKKIFFFLSVVLFCKISIAISSSSLIFFFCNVNLLVISFIVISTPSLYFSLWKSDLDLFYIFNVSI